MRLGHIHKKTKIFAVEEFTMKETDNKQWVSYIVYFKMINAIERKPS